MCIHIYINMCIQIFEYIYIYTQYKHVYMYIHVYIYIYVHVYTHQRGAARDLFGDTLDPLAQARM